MHVRRKVRQLPGSPGIGRGPSAGFLTLAAIREIPPPKTATEVRSFLGLAGYYWQYVKNFAAIAGPLHSLTRKDAVFHWSPDCQTAFDRLKTLLTTSPITAFLDFSQAFRLYTDASATAKSASSAALPGTSTRLRRPTLPLNWSA